MLDFSIYLLYRVAAVLISALPLRFLFHLGELLGWTAWLFLPAYRRLVRRNLAIAFRDEKNSAELAALTRRHFQRLGANLLCSIKLGTMPVEEIAPCVSLENEDLLHHELRGGRSVVFALSHLGSWELFPQLFPSHFGYVRCGTIYQALGNRYLDAEVQRHRARAGLQLFDRRSGFQGPIALLRAGGVIGVLADQHAGDQGLWTPFFGRLASTTPLPGLLAKRTGAGVMSAAIYTAGPARWRMVFTPRLEAPGDSIETITEKCNRVIAEQIRRAPEDWFWVHNRWKTPKPNFLLSEYKRGVYLGAGAPSRRTQEPAAADRPEGGPAPTPSDQEPLSTLTPFRILIRSTNWLGDSVISAAAVRAIKHGRPDAHVTIATPEKIAAVWRLIPEVDEVLPLAGSSVFKTARLLGRQREFDVAILFPNSLRAALEIWLARIPRRVGYRGHHRSWLLNQIVPEPATPGPIKHQVHRYLRIARNLGAVADGTQTTHRTHTSHEPARLALCAGAEYGPAKRWLPERFAEVAAAVSAQHRAHWLLFGTSADGEIGNTIASALGENCTNRIGQTTLDELITELRACRLLLTNDTGTMHLATLLGVPVVAIFGSTEQRLTGPLGDGNIVIRHHVECSPCFLRECPLDFRCMHAVTSDEVVAAVASIFIASHARPGMADSRAG